jgi:DnaK suppressor protein
MRDKREGEIEDGPGLQHEVRVRVPVSVDPCDLPIWGSKPIQRRWRAFMEHAKAKELLDAERLRLEQLLVQMGQEGGNDRTAANQEGDMFDSAEPLTTEGTDNSIKAELQSRLAAVERAEQRLVDGTYGLSIRSGQPIPDNRLEADPAAELTVEEASS